MIRRMITISNEMLWWIEKQKFLSVFIVNLLTLSEMSPNNRSCGRAVLRRTLGVFKEESLKNYDWNVKFNTALAFISNHNISIMEVHSCLNCTCILFNPIIRLTHEFTALRRNDFCKIKVVVGMEIKRFIDTWGRRWIFPRSSILCKDRKKFQRNSRSPLWSIMYRQNTKISPNLSKSNYSLWMRWSTSTGRRAWHHFVLMFWNTIDGRVIWLQVSYATG